MISAVRRPRGDLTIYQIVTASGQRMTVAVPYRYSTAAQVDDIIRHTVAGLVRPTKPVHGP